MTASWTISPSPSEPGDLVAFPVRPATEVADPGGATPATITDPGGATPTTITDPSGATPTTLPRPTTATDPGRGSVAVIACGALALHVSEIAERHGWPVDVHPLPPLLHNRPDRIAPRVAALATELRGRYDTVAVGYADCGTYGALDQVCEQFGIPRLAGSHCYDVFAGAERMRALLEAEPGTYVLTDFLVRSFRRTVLAELGLDRYPELRDDYFGHYRRLVWLAQHPTDDLRREARTAAETIALPLETIVVGDALLERQLSDLLGRAVRASA